MSSGRASTRPQVGDGLVEHPEHLVDFRLPVVEVVLWLSASAVRARSTIATRSAGSVVFATSFNVAATSFESRRVGVGLCLHVRLARAVAA